MFRTAGWRGKSLPQKNLLTTIKTPITNTASQEHFPVLAFHPNHKSLFPQASPPLRAEPGSSRRKNTTSVSISAPSSPRNSRRSTAKKKSTTGGITGAVGDGGSNDSDAPYTFDYFGLAGQRGVWRGLESVSAARAEVGFKASVVLILIVIGAALTSKSICEQALFR